MSRKRLPDDVACKRILRGQRKYRATYTKHKKITEPLFRIGGSLLSSTYQITYNLKTNRMSISEDFVYKGRGMLQSPRHVLKCNTEEGIRYIQEQRKSASEYYYENKRNRMKVTKEQSF